MVVGVVVVVVVGVVVVGVVVVVVGVVVVGVVVVGVVVVVVLPPSVEPRFGGGGVEDGTGPWPGCVPPTFGCGDAMYLKCAASLGAEFP